MRHLRSEENRHSPPEQAGGQLRRPDPGGPHGSGDAEPARWLRGLSRNDLMSSVWCTPKHRAPLTTKCKRGHSLTHLRLSCESLNHLI